MKDNMIRMILWNHISILVYAHALMAFVFTLLGWEE